MLYTTSRGRFFLFEHPAEATLWSTNMIGTIAHLEGVHVVKFDFCMKSIDANGDNDCGDGQLPESSKGSCSVSWYNTPLHPQFA